MKTDLSKPICIVGTGGFAREVLCCVLDVFDAQGKDPVKNISFLDHDGKGVKGELLGFPVIQAQDFNPVNWQCVVAIGNPKVREFVVRDLPEHTVYATLIHPSAIISKWVEMGTGSIVTAGCVITTQIKIGEHAQLNLNTTVGHDTTIGDFFTTATNVSVSGICEIGNRVYMGSNSAVKQGLQVCSDVTIGMGAMLVKSADTPGVYVGTPAKLHEA
ncbi:MAG: NeuD/PglB/VioB family sugar acetyltransferase [Schleiferiaceae bacterium]|jgi:sugar O-acyltransferase (sialic acid O-acetyltransferase NeuD family)|nr:NeuD/PglB/VioB family sugar acetyltransferase [Schleiferiaceae bacterium]